MYDNNLPELPVIVWKSENMFYIKRTIVQFDLNQDHLFMAGQVLAAWYRTWS